MADETFFKKMIFVNFGKNLRQYPFSFVTLKSADGTIVGEGISPDGDMTYRGDVLSSDLDVAQIDPNFVVNPKILETNELATGVMYNRFQW